MSNTNYKETHKFLEGKDTVRCDKAQKNKPHQYI